MFLWSGKGMCTTHAGMTLRPGGLVEGPQALASQEGPGAGMIGSEIAW